MAAKINKLNIYLSNLAVLNVKIHNLHWNVVGPQFLMVHELTEKLYKMFQEQFDTVAELMKMQNEIPLASLEDYLDNATVEELEGREFGDIEVIEILDADCGNIMELAKDIRDEADKKDNFQVANLFEEYLAVFAKYSWMIKAMLKDDTELDDTDIEETENENN